MKLYTWGKGKTHNAYERIRRKIGDTFESKVIRACLSRKEHEKGRVLFWTDSGMFDLFRLHKGLAYALKGGD